MSFASGPTVGISIPKLSYGGGVPSSCLISNDGFIQDSCQVFQKLNLARKAFVVSGSSCAENACTCPHGTSVTGLGLERCPETAPDDANNEFYDESTSSCNADCLESFRTVLLTLRPTNAHKHPHTDTVLSRRPIKVRTSALRPRKGRAVARQPFCLFWKRTTFRLRYAVILCELPLYPNTSDLELAAAAWVSQKWRPERIRNPRLLLTVFRP